MAKKLRPLRAIPAVTEQTEYSRSAPYLWWKAFTKVQRFRAPRPEWMAMCLSLWTDPKYRGVWEARGDAGLALVTRLLFHLASTSAGGTCLGQPEALGIALDLPGDADISWLVEAGWCCYVSASDRAALEEAAAKDPPKGREKAESRGRAEPTSPGRESPAPSDAPAKKASPRKTRVPSVAVAAREKAIADWLGKNPNLTAGDLAEQLGCSKAVIFKSPVWRAFRSRGLVEKQPGGTVENDTGNFPSNPEKNAPGDSATAVGKKAATETETETVTGTGTGTATGDGPWARTGDSRKQSSGESQGESRGGSPATRTEGQGQKQRQAQPEGQGQVQDSTGNPQGRFAGLSPGPGPSALGQPPGPLVTGPPVPAGSFAVSTGFDAGPRVAAGGPRGRRSRPDALLLAECLGPLGLAKQCRAVGDWVQACFVAMRFGYDADGPRGRQQCGSLASAYSTVTGAPIPAAKQHEILDRMLKEAVRLGLKRPSQIRTDKGAVFNSILKKRLRAARIKGHDGT